MFHNRNALQAIVIHTFRKSREQKVYMPVDAHRCCTRDALVLPFYFACFSITSVMRASIGSSTKNVEPSPLTPVDSAHKRPPCISTRRRLIGRPKPVPPALRVDEVSTCVNSWKTASSLSAEMPMPVSVTEIKTLAPSIDVTFTAILPVSVNLMALLTRLIMTWRKRV